MDTLVPKDHLLRKIEKVMDYDWLYERLEGYYCHTNGRPGTDPVVLIKMVLLQHLFGIPSLRQTYREVQVNLAYRWFLGHSAYKTPWIAKKTIDDGIVPILPYTRYKGAKGSYRPWEYAYLPEKDAYLCPQGAELRHTTTDKDGKRVYRSTPKNCRDCPYKAKCGANEKGQKLLTRHIWQSYLDAVECIRKTEDAKCIYAMRQQTIERVFADAKEKHAMRYTHHRGLTAVTRWVKLKFAAMNLKKLAVWSWKDSFLLLLSLFPIRVFHKTRQNPCLAAC